MKDESSLPRLVVIADQRRSRRSADRVPQALEALAPLSGHFLLPFERTAGDEIQGLTAQPGAVVAAVLTLTRLGDWRIGIGVGDTELPLPASTRQARGSAYVAAREAVDAARTAPTGLTLVAAETVGDAPYGGSDPARVSDAETALVLLRALVDRRTTEGWELVDLLDSGLNSKAAAESLGVSASAVSQRLRTSAYVESMRGAHLAARLLAAVLDAR